jgi:hypothetical protein
VRNDIEALRCERVRSYPSLKSEHQHGPIKDQSNIIDNQVGKKDTGKTAEI